ncbi:MAG: glycosyltransferase family 4 protein [Planctomycetota bacterium]|jgi:glycosyltransferase involved in cell wall biosynthesis|nr:glycosyltransferase family 4 protein [Planctomycetota bacterium]
MAKPIHVLWLIESPDQSGIAFAAKHMAGGLIGSGVKLSMMAIRPGVNAEDFAQLGCPVQVFPRLGSFLFGGPSLAAARKLEIDLIHTLTPNLARQGLSLAKRLKVPIVATVNRMDWEEIRHIADFRGTGVIAVSDAIRERLANTAGIPQHKIRVIPTGLDLSKLPRPDFSPIQESLFTPVVGTLGQLTERKGQRVFLLAAANILRRGFDAEFVIFGDGPDRMALRQLATELKINKRVTFAPQTLSGQLVRINVLVEPSLQEGLGLSVMQAMAMGVPVVGTGVGGLYSLIEDGKTGLMVQANNPQALASAIWRVLKHPEDSLEMARMARELIEEQFSIEVVIPILVDYYRSIISGDLDKLPSRTSSHPPTSLSVREVRGS